jgi:hypothetical protein
VVSRPALARLLLLAGLAGLALGLTGGPAPEGAGGRAGPAARAGRTVYLARGLSDEALLALGASVAADGAALLLLDSDRLSPYTRAFLASYRPGRVVPVGCFPAGVVELERRLDVAAEAVVPCADGPPEALWRELHPRAKRVVVCPAGPRGRLLQAACLAGAAGAPLVVLHGRAGEADGLRERLAGWQTRQAYLVGEAGGLVELPADIRTVRLADERALAAAHVGLLGCGGPVRTAVVANPADTAGGLGGMSVLAPWVAVQRRAALLLTNERGDDVEALAATALGAPPLREVDAVLFVAGLRAVPMRQRPNPIPADKDPQIDMEPLTPDGPEPFSFATGRLFHEDVAVVPLLLARQRLLARARGPRRVLVASNPGGTMPLLEAFSRNTARELRNAGYETTALFGKEVNGDDLRRLMPEHDIFLWEGHHNPLIRDWGLPGWDEPLPPALVFLQSCLALKDYKAQPLLSRGAVGVVGTSTRTYSASGGACAHAFFNALLYEGRPVGAALRQAKNFLLAYALLKERRLGKAAARAGANRRSAWAFTLWGDPTLELPRPEAPDDARPALRCEVDGDAVVLRPPAGGYEEVTSARYRVETFPNARLAGLLRPDRGDDGRRLVPLWFAEVPLPGGPPGRAPRLRGPLPASHYVFCWDARRRCGYLLVDPPAGAARELRFHVEWGCREVARRTAAGAAE